MSYSNQIYIQYLSCWQPNYRSMQALQGRMSLIPSSSYLQDQTDDFVSAQKSIDELPIMQSIQDLFERYQYSKPTSQQVTSILKQIKETAGDTCKWLLCQILVIRFYDQLLTNQQLPPFGFADIVIELIPEHRSDELTFVPNSFFIPIWCATSVRGDIFFNLLQKKSPFLIPFISNLICDVENMPISSAKTSVVDITHIQTAYVFYKKLPHKHDNESMTTMEQHALACSFESYFLLQQSAWWAYIKTQFMQRNFSDNYDYVRLCYTCEGLPAEIFTQTYYQLVEEYGVDSDKVTQFAQDIVETTEPYQFDEAPILWPILQSQPYRSYWSANVDTWHDTEDQFPIYHIQHFIDFIEYSKMKSVKFHICETEFESFLADMIFEIPEHYYQTPSDRITLIEDLKINLLKDWKLESALVVYCQQDYMWKHLQQMAFRVTLLENLINCFNESVDNGWSSTPPHSLIFFTAYLLSISRPEELDALFSNEQIALFIINHFVQLLYFDRGLNVAIEQDSIRYSTVNKTFMRYKLKTPLACLIDYFNRSSNRQDTPSSITLDQKTLQAAKYFFQLATPSFYLDFYPKITPFHSESEQEFLRLLSKSSTQTTVNHSDETDIDMYQSPNSSKQKVRKLFRFLFQHPELTGILIRLKATYITAYLNKIEGLDEEGDIKIEDDAYTAQQLMMVASQNLPTAYSTFGSTSNSYSYPPELGSQSELELEYKVETRPDFPALDKHHPPTLPKHSQSLFIQRSEQLIQWLVQNYFAQRWVIQQQNGVSDKNGITQLTELSTMKHLKRFRDSLRSSCYSFFYSRSLSKAKYQHAVDTIRAILLHTTTMAQLITLLEARIENHDQQFQNFWHKSHRLLYHSYQHLLQQARADSPMPLTNSTAAQSASSLELFSLTT